VSFILIEILEFGTVWAFGCGLFGQLGNGENKKQTSPIRVDFSRTLRYEGIDDKIGQIATKFFHCLALSTDHKRVYVWGCSPQVLIAFLFNLIQSSSIFFSRPCGLKLNKNAVIECTSRYETM